MHVLRSITLQAVAVSMSERATTVRSPANLASEDGVNELSTTHGVVERSTSVKGDVIEAPVPDSGVCHSVSGESKDGSNDGASKDIVEVVILVDSESSTDENGTEKRGVGDDELPHGRMVVGEDLELGVEVKVQVDEASKGSSGVTTGHGLKSIVDLALVASADIGSVVKLKISLVVVSSHGASASHVGLADLKEMRSESTDEPLDKDLEDGGGDEGVEKTDGSVVEVPETADAGLHASEDEDGDQSSKHGGSPDGNDLASEGVAILGPDNFAVVEGNREGSHRCRLSEVDLRNCQTLNKD